MSNRLKNDDSFITKEKRQQVPVPAGYIMAVFSLNLRAVD